MVVCIGAPTVFTPNLVKLFSFHKKSFKSLAVCTGNFTAGSAFFCKFHRLGGRT